MLRVLAGTMLIASALAGCRNPAGTTDLDTCASGLSSATENLAACDRALARDDVDAANRARLLLGRGLAHHALGHVDVALADLDEAVRLSPKDTAVLANRGVMLSMQGKDDAAMRDLDAALAIEPDHVRARINRAIAHSQSGRFREARADVDHALAIEPANPSLWTERCWVGAVLADELPRTLEDCTRALSLAPDDPNNHNNLGFVHFRSGRYEQSIAHYDRSIEGDPNVASSYLMRGLARRALGDAAGAEADLGRADALDPGVAARYAGYGVEAGTP